VLDAGGDLFLDKVYFFRSSIFHNIFKRCVVFAAFLLDSWLELLVFLLLFLSTLPFVYNISKCGGCYKYVELST
jgi:hypothetical protein